MRDVFMDLETYSPEPINNGSHRYAEKAEVLLWAYADGDGDIKVWDAANGCLHWQDELTGLWEEQYIGKPFPPQSLTEILHDPEAAVWFHNGGMFDFVVLQHAMPELLKLVDISRWRDTMVQAFAHALPGALEKLGEVLNLHEDRRKIADGKKLVRLFCMPQNEDFKKKFGTDRATKATHPAEWQRFVQYAGGDIVTMREVRRIMPSWNYKDKQLLLWHTDLKINNRGFAVDLELAQRAVAVAAVIQERLSQRVQKATDDEVGSATQRDAMLDFLQPLCAEFGVELPDLRADTLERRLEDPDLPDYIKDLLRIRLEASMNSVSKFKTLLKRVSSDGRLRGSMQFRGAGRTGRWAHRGFQPGNLPRASLSHELIEFAIECIKSADLDAMDLVFPNLMLAISNTIRGVIVAGKGKKLVVADLSNIEGRGAAWLAGEDWKLEAFRQFDKGIGHDLYIVAYASSFGISLEGVEPKDGKKFIGAANRQIGKVEELMFQYGGGVGAWLTGAATYGIDLAAMTESVWDTIPEWAKLEAADFLHWLYEQNTAKLQRKLGLLDEKAKSDDTQDVGALLKEFEELNAKIEAAKVKCRYGLTERVFIACDAIKRLWRKAHPAITSYWKDLENTVKAAIDDPGVTYPCRKVKIRRDGAWLRIGLPSGRALCYPNPGVDKDGSIFYTGHNPYTRQWGKVKTYGGKLCLASGTLVLTLRGWVVIESVTSDDKVWDGDEWVSTTGLLHKGAAEVICAYGAWMTPDHEVLTEQGWKRASQSEGLDRADCRLPDGVEVPRQRRETVVVGGAMQCLRESDQHAGFGVHEAAAQGRHRQLRMHAQADDRSQEFNARDVKAPGVLGVAQHGGSLHVAFASGLAELRWAWHHGLRAVAGFVQGLLGRHGRQLPQGADDRTGAQRQRVLADQLCLGYAQGAGQQHTPNGVRANQVGESHADQAVGAFRHRAVNAGVPALAGREGRSAAGEARCVAEVFDLMDCGPRHRFTILADGRPLIVHNCENITQAVACDQLAECMPAAELAGYETVLSVHDELVTETPDSEDFTVDELAAIMCSDLGWNAGLPLAAAGFETDRYRKGD